MLPVELRFPVRAAVTNFIESNKETISLQRYLNTHLHHYQQSSKITKAAFEEDF